MIRFGNRDVAGTGNSNLSVPSSPLRRVVQLGSPLFTRKKSNSDLYGLLDSDEDGSIPFKDPKSTDTGKKIDVGSTQKTITTSESPKSVQKDPSLVSLQASIDKLLLSTLGDGDDASISVEDCVNTKAHGQSGDLANVDILYHLTSRDSKSDSNLSNGCVDDLPTSPRVIRRRRTLSHQLSFPKKGPSTTNEGTRLRASSSILSTRRRRSLVGRGSSGFMPTEFNEGTTVQLGRHSSHEILRDRSMSESKSEDRLTAPSNHESMTGKSTRRSGQLSRRARRVPSKTNRVPQLSTLHETETSTIPTLSTILSPRVSPIVQPKRRNSLYISLYDKPTDTEGADSRIASIPDSGRSSHVVSTKSYKEKAPIPYEPDFSATRRLSSESDHAVWISSSSGHNRHLEVDFSSQH
jgi:hypothetical protein